MAKIKGTSKVTLISKAEINLKSAEKLAGDGDYDNAVYLSGYCCEFLLKAIICQVENIPYYPDKKKYRTHNLEKLVNLALIREELQLKMKSDIGFQINWSLATDWHPSIRYNPPEEYSKQSWDDRHEALTSVERGVLPWLRSCM